MLLRLLGGDPEALASDALGEFFRRSRQGGVVPLRIGLTRAHLVSDPALVRHVLLDNAAGYDQVTPAFDAVRVVLGNGMLTSAGRLEASAADRPARVPRGEREAVRADPLEDGDRDRRPAG